MGDGVPNNGEGGGGIDDTGRQLLLPNSFEIAVCFDRMDQEQIDVIQLQFLQRLEECVLDCFTLWYNVEFCGHEEGRSWKTRFLDGLTDRGFVTIDLCTVQVIDACIDSNQDFGGNFLAIKSSSSTERKPGNGVPIVELNGEFGRHDR